MDEDFYVDFSLGYDIKAQALDYGLGLGAAFETETPSTVADPTPDPTGDGDTGCVLTGGIAAVCD